MTKKELKIKLNDIIDRKQLVHAEYIASKSNNPQVKEIMSRIDAEIIAFNSILDALNDNDAMINCY